MNIISTLIGLQYKLIFCYITNSFPTYPTQTCLDCTQFIRENLIKYTFLYFTVCILPILRSFLSCIIDTKYHWHRFSYISVLVRKILNRKIPHIKAFFSSSDAQQNIRIINGYTVQNKYTIYRLPQ